MGYINDPPRFNNDLFYDSQLQNDSLTWRLRTKNEKGIVDVLRAPLSDVDQGFSYAVSHEYSGASELDILKQGEQLVDKGLSMARNIDMGVGKAVEIAKNIGDKITGNNAVSSLVGETVNKSKSWVDNNLKKISNGNVDSDRVRNLYYGKLVSAFDFIKVFQGTQIELSLPTLEVTLLDYDGNSIGKQIKALNSLFIGDIENIDSVVDEKGYSSGLWGIQTAPNKYKPKFNGLDETTSFPGVFYLFIGKKYMINDLIIRGFNVNSSGLSRRGGNGQPAFAEVTIQLDFASYVTKKKIERYLAIDQS